MSYKVTTKKNLIILHNASDWDLLLDRLEQDFGHRIRMRHIMLRELGFVVRHHRGLAPNRKLDQIWAVLQSQSQVIEDAPGYHYEYQVHLDFYTESAQSWFILKYL